MKGVLRSLPTEKELSWGLKALCDKLETRREIGRRLRWSPEQQKCPLCNTYQQTLKHVLNGCPTALDEGRYTQRHDAVLKELVSRLRLAGEKRQNFKLWADLEGERKPADKPKGMDIDLEAKFRPDIFVSYTEDGREHLVIIELTCPFEDKKGTENAHQRKLDKYSALMDGLKVKNHYDRLELHAIEVGSRGYIANTLNGIKKYLECGRGQMSVKNFFHKLGKISLLRSMHIYQNRDRKVVNLKH